MRRRIQKKRKFNTPPPGDPVTISESALGDSDNEIVFNVPQAKKFKKDPDLNPDITPENVAKTKSETVPEEKVKVPEEDPEELKPRRSPNGYILPDPLPQGLVIKDLRNQNWKIGKSVGLGGFGEIYSAALLNGKPFTFSLKKQLFSPEHKMDYLFLT